MRRISLFIQRALVMLAGVLLLGVSPALAQVAVNLPSVTGEAGTSGQIPITVGDLTGQNVLSYEFTITYNPAVLDITGASVAGTLSEGVAPTVNTEVNGQISVAYASTTPLSGSGTLINLDADFLADGNSALTFTNFQFNEGAPAAVLTGGAVVVPEVAIRVPADTSGFVGDAAFVIPVTTEAIPAGKSVLSYQFTITFDPAVLNFDPATAEGTLSEGFTVQTNRETAGQITVAAAGTSAIPAGAVGTLINLNASLVGAGTSALTFSNVQFNEGDPNAGGVGGQVTVSVEPPVNQAPVFTAELGNTTIAEGQTLTFEYQATDPNGDALTFSLVNPPAGATINATSGLFTFTPTFEQAGTHQIVAVVSDGALTDTSRATITVLDVFTRGANLAGVNEVPPVQSPGSGTVTVVATGNTIVVTGSFSGLSAQYTASHIHLAPVGVSGGVVVPLTATVGSDGRSGTYTAANNTVDLTTLTFSGGNTAASVLAAIRDGNTYVNVHTTANAPGELRGQLLPVPNRPPAASSITSPADGARFVIQGDGEALLFNFAWGEATDPDGNAIAYIVQFAVDPGFVEVIDSEISPVAASFPISAADAAELYDLITGGYPGAIQVGGEVTVYARVITTDGSLWTVGPRASVVLERRSLIDREAEGMLPEHFALHGNYPNPFNPSTTIRFDLPAASEVSIQVVDLLGRQVMVVPSQSMTAGANRTLQLDAASLASGLYLYRVVARSAAETHIQTGRMTLLK